MKHLTSLACGVIVASQLSGQTVALFHVEQPPAFVVNAGPDVAYETGLMIGGTPTAQGGGGSYSYAWTPAEQLDDPTAATPIVLSLSAQTTFTVSVTDELTGCTKTDQVTIDIEQGLGSNTIGKTLLFPNPSVDRVWIEASEPLDHVRIRNISGQEVLGHATNGNSSVSLDITSISEGFFLVNLTFSSGRNQTIKLCHVRSSR